MILSAKRLRQIVSLYLLLLGAVTVVYGWHNARAANDWAIGEWLINYSGGFVRRGLPGEVALLCARASSVPVITLVFVLQLLVFAGFFWAIFQLTRNIRWSLPMLAILFSPATLAFHVLDPPAGFRKEILLFASLSLLLVLLAKERLRAWQMSLVLTAAAEVCVLSHEPLVLYLPYLLGAIFLALPTLRQAIVVCGLPAVLAAATVLVCARHPGSEATAATICSSVGSTLGGSNQGVCGGAILYLSRSLDYARADTVASIRLHHYFRLYSITGALTLAPFVALLLSAGESISRRSWRILGVVFACAGAASSVLFVVATDWGRWIYIHAVCLMLLTLFLAQRSTVEMRAREQESMADGMALRPRSIPLLAMVGLYATMWTLPHVGLFPGRFGYLDLARYLHSYRQKIHSAAAPEPSIPASS